MNNFEDLYLSLLKQGLPGVSKAAGLYHAEACLICLETHKHLVGVNLEVRGSFNGCFRLIWDDLVTDQVLRSWKDFDDATEYAACGVAFLLILSLTEYTIIERSRKGTGFDYYMGFKDALIFQGSARLEVSGIFRANSESEITSRVNQKLRQTDRSDLTSMPAYVVIVEFSRPISYVVKK
jgi:hypothetical protein